MRNHTKKALVLSALSLVLCVSMLVGTTFAWFTDSVTTGVNVIKSGTLDIDLEYSKTMADNSWKNAEGAIDVLNPNALWEPGHTEVVYLRITNKGDLDLKYQFAMNVLSSVKGTSVLGNEINLADYLMYDIVETNAAFADRATALKAVEEGKKLVGETVFGEMKEQGAVKTLALIVYMPETVGNEANYRGDVVPSINLSFSLMATQLNSENDSFGPDYDKDATFATTVANAASLEAALAKGGLIELADDITVEKTLTVPAGVVATLDLNGKTITGTKGRDVNNNRIHVLVNNGILTVNDGTIKSAGNDGGSAICNNAGASLTVNDVALYGAPQSDPVYEAGIQKPYPSYAVNNYGKMVVNGAIVKSYHGAIATGDNGNTVINDADIDVGLGQSTGITSYAIYSYDEAQVTINGGKFAFTKQEIYVNGGNTFCELGTNPIIINGGNYIGTSFSTDVGREYIINAGTFDKDPTAYAKGEVFDNGNGTWTVKPFEVSTATDLVDKLANGNPVVLTDDIAFNTTLSIEKDAYIDANGNTIKFTSGSSTRFIDVPNTANGANLTIKNAVIDIDGTYCQRGINYNTNGTLLLDNVTLTGSTKATYGINMPSSSANATVEMTNCDITALIALNIWGENVVVNVKDCNLSNYDNNSTEGENYTTIKLNNDGTYAANGAIVTITGGSITAKDETGADFIAINNNTATGVVVVSDTTVVNGIVETNVAIVRYRDGNGNFYNEFHGATTLQDAVTLAAKNANAEVFLLTDITVDTLDVPANVIIHKNGHALTIGATTSSGALNIVD